MINPQEITNYNQTKFQLEETIIFWILVAGKNAKNTAKSLDKLLNKIDGYKNGPFNSLKKYSLEQIKVLLKESGIGCYNYKSKYIIDLINKNVDLKKCSIKELESVKGIGLKTSRCFLLHSRKNQKLSGLDVHILQHLKFLGHDVPKNTPSKSKYLELEKIIISLAEKENMSYAEYDLTIWNKYSRKLNV